MRLKSKELKAFRLKKLKEQDFTCPLCETEILEHEATLDHDHGTGYCRGVLHRSCNQTEGRILSWIKRSRGEDPTEFIQNLLLYWQRDYTGGYLHPTHLTETEKEIKRLKKRAKKVKTARAKQRYKDKIRLLRLVNSI